MNKILILLALAISFAGADTLKVSSPIAEFNKFVYENPQGKKINISNTTRTIIVSFEKDTGKLVNEYLDTKHPLYLGRLGAVFIADINKMPSIITKLFALPMFRDYKHPIYLHYKDKFEKYVPSKEDKVTVIKLKNEKVQSISFISTQEELKGVLEK